MNLYDVFEELNKPKVKILNDDEFFNLVSRSNINNSRFDISQFEKNVGTNDGYYCLMDDNNILAAAQVKKNVLNLDDLYINELQSFITKHGYGEQLLTSLIKNNENIWLMSQPIPENPKLVKYYERFKGLYEFILPKSKSCYGVDTYFFANIKDKKAFKTKIKSEYKK